MDNSFLQPQNQHRPRQHISRTSIRLSTLRLLRRGRGLGPTPPRELEPRPARCRVDRLQSRRRLLWPRKLPPRVLAILIHSRL